MVRFNFSPAFPDCYSIVLLVIDCDKSGM